jgi:dihydrolipoamide dehydrogenase
MYLRAQHEFASHGIQIGDVTMDIAQMQKRKTGVVNGLTGGIASLFKANGVDSLAGQGQVLDSGQVQFTPHDGDAETIEAKHIIIASGSAPVELGVASFDGDRVVDSTGALDFTEAPKKLGVIGAGIIGVELGSVWSRLGSEVTLLEALDDFMPVVDREVAQDAFKAFKKEGMAIELGARVTAAKVNKKSVRVDYTQGEDEHSMTFDRLIVAVGRRPNTDGLIAKGARIEFDDKGFVAVNDSFRTSLPNVYAVGDVIGGPMLAHKGMEEGVVLVERLAGQKPHMNYETVPSVVYTDPEIAWVGKGESQAKAEGYDYRVGKVPFAANGRAKAMSQQGGFVKMIADAKTDEILGVHMTGPFVSELSQEIVVAMEYKASSEDVARIIHGHPTLSETVHEAALAVDSRPIHFPPPRKKKK